MANLLFQTYIAPYRIDTYNALHEKTGMQFYFLYTQHGMQKFDMASLYSQCNFKPKFLRTISLFSKYYKICTNIWSILKEEKPEIVIVPEFKILTLQVLLHKYIFFKRYKVISMCDDSYDMVANDHDFSKIHKFSRQIVVPFLDNLLLVDSRVAKWYKNRYHKGIWLPIIRDEKKEAPLYENVIHLSKDLSDRFNLNLRKVLLFVGRLDPVKNLETLFKAISITTEDFVTVIVGDGELESQLKQQASEMTKPIVFAGRYEGDGVRAWYNIADVFVLASKQEAYGAVTNEALIAGVPCIISENAGSACLINETNGLVINPYDIDSMAQTLNEIMKKVVVKEKMTARPSKMPFTFNDILDRTISQMISYK